MQINFELSEDLAERIELVDDGTYEVRLAGRRLAEISLLPSGRYQITSPWSRHTYPSMRSAIQAARHQERSER
jgi:hypothetical protein